MWSMSSRTCRRSAWSRTSLRTVVAAAFCAAAAALSVPARAQHAGVFRGSLDDPAIDYSSPALNNVITDVNRALLDGSLRFTFAGRGGFLQSALDALHLPVSSQLLVF